MTVFVVAKSHVQVFTSKNLEPGLPRSYLIFNLRIVWNDTYRKDA